MVKKIRCDVASGDWVKAKVSAGGDLVFIQMAFYGEFPNVMLSPADARKLRKQIKKALEAIEGDVSEAEAPVIEHDNSKPKAGDRIRILFDRADCAPVSEGDKFIVKYVEEDGGVVVEGDPDWVFSAENFEVIGSAVPDCKPA